MPASIIAAAKAPVYVSLCLINTGCTPPHGYRLRFLQVRLMRPMLPSTVSSKDTQQVLFQRQSRSVESRGCDIAGGHSHHAPDAWCFFARWEQRPESGLAVSTPSPLSAAENAGGSGEWVCRTPDLYRRQDDKACAGVPSARSRDQYPSSVLLSDIGIPLIAKIWGMPGSGLSSVSFTGSRS
jgi:hypothetical protein